MIRRWLFTPLLALALGAAPLALADPPPEADTDAAPPARKRYRAPVTGIPGEVHEPQVTFIQGRPKVVIDEGDLEIVRGRVPRLEAVSSLPRGDG
jgi:hypothetical protein